MIGKTQILSPEQCDALVQELTRYSWLPGATGQSSYSDKVKQNEELYRSEDNRIQEMLTKIGTTIIQNQFFSQRVFPIHLGIPRFARTTNGGFYGLHTDSAFMGNNPEIRTDVSMTLFLTDDYEGGELVMHWHSGHITCVKEPKGTMVFYPTNVMHEVTPVTEGERIVFVAWSQSHIEDSAVRDILSEVTLLADDVGEQTEMHGELHNRAVNLKHKLWRRWMRS